MTRGLLLRQLKLLGLMSAGALVGVAFGFAILTGLAPWWAHAKWLHPAWILGAYLLCVSAGMLAGAEAGMVAGRFRTSAPPRQRVAFRAVLVATIVAWIVVGQRWLWHLEPWGFWLSLACLVGLHAGFGIVGRRRGVVLLRDSADGQE